MRNLLFIFTILFSSFLNAQIEFEEGYFITIENDRVNCLIKNKDWQYTPSTFQYKLNSEGTIQTKTILDINEFGITGKTKFIKRTVLIDRSSDIVSKLTDEKKPNFNEETLFLNVLVEGEATLAMYEDEEIIRFFFSKATIQLEQLVHKRYMLLPTIVARNNNFRQQLYNNLKCPGSNIESKVQSIYYSKNEMIDIFSKYNECSGSAQIIYGDNRKKDLFNLSLRPRYRNLSLAIASPTDIPKYVNFEPSTGFAFGLETEFIIPFNKNKWAIVIEPSYVEFLATVNAEASLIGGTVDVDIDYRAIELPMGLRYYLFLNDHSKLFLNAFYTADFDFNSKITLTRVTGETFDTIDIHSRPNLYYGLGYKFKNRVSVEFRTMTTRILLGPSESWTSDLDSYSFILGITLL